MEEVFYMKKSVKWLIVWGVLMHAGALVSAVYQIVYIFKTGGPPAYPPYPTFILLVLFGFLPFVAIPTVAASWYFAIKEKIKSIKIITSFILFQHILVLILAIIEHLTAIF